MLTSRNYYLMLKDEMEKASLQRLLGDAAPWISSRSARSDAVTNSENGAETLAGNGAERIAENKAGVGESRNVGNDICAVRRRSTTPRGGQSGLSTLRREAGSRGGEAGSRGGVAGGGRSAWEKQAEDARSQAFVLIPF